MVSVENLVQFPNDYDLNLEQVLCTPKTIVNLSYVHKLCKDNQVSMEFDHSGFYIKDLHSKEVNTQGPR